MKASLSAPVLCIALGLAVAGCGGDSSSGADAGEGSTSVAKTETESFPIEPVGELRGPKLVARGLSGPLPKKLVVKDLKLGGGREARNGEKVTIQFTAVHFNGTPYESSWDFGHPFRFELGTGDLSPAWERGLPGMKVGGRRELLVPWKVIASTGIPPETGPDDGQVYVIDLLAVS